MLDLGKTTYKHLVFPWNDFLRLGGAQNESLRLILIYYMFEYTFGIKRTLLDSIRNPKPIRRLDFDKTSYKDLVFAQGEFLRLVGAPNESVWLIIIYYMF